MPFTYLSHSNIEFVISPSLSFGNKYYLFRRNGQEIQFDIINNQIHNNIELTQEEKKYLNKKFIKI